MSIEKEHGIVPDRAVVQHFATDTVMIKRNDLKTNLRFAGSACCTNTTSKPFL
jgi:hypothetical protein